MVAPVRNAMAMESLGRGEIDMAISNRYDAGTFKFNVVPEPQSIALVLLALGAGAVARKRQA